MDPEDPDSDLTHFWQSTFIKAAPFSYAHMGKIARSPNDKESLKKFQDPDDPDSDPDYSQNVITCSLSHF